LQFDDREIAPEMEDDSSESAAVHDEMDDPPGKNPQRCAQLVCAANSS